MYHTPRTTTPLHTAYCVLHGHTSCCTLHSVLCSACHTPQKAGRAAIDALCPVKEAEPLSDPSQKPLLCMGLKGLYSLPSRQELLLL